MPSPIHDLGLILRRRRELLGKLNHICKRLIFVERRDDQVLALPIVANAGPIERVFPFLRTDAGYAKKLDPSSY